MSSYVILYLCVAARNEAGFATPAVMTAQGINEKNW